MGILMIKTKSISSTLRDARNKVISLATEAATEGNTALKIEWQRRRAFLDSQILEFKNMQEGFRPKQSVFVSYNVKNTVVFNIIEQRLRDATFEVHTGFQKSDGDRGNVLERVRAQLDKSTLFLGIFSKDAQVLDPDGEHQWAPSVWSVEEKGMALALGKPFVLMVEEGVSEKYWSKTTPHKVHYMYNNNNVLSVIDTVIDVMKDRYSDVLLEYLQKGVFD